MSVAAQLPAKRLSVLLRSQSRTLASVSGSLNPNSLGPFQVFDRSIKVLQKDSGALLDGGKRSRTVDYVRNEVAERMIETV